MCAKAKQKEKFSMHIDEGSPLSEANPFSALGRGEEKDKFAYIEDEREENKLLERRRNDKFWSVSFRRARQFFSLSSTSQGRHGAFIATHRARFHSSHAS